MGKSTIELTRDMLEFAGITEVYPFGVKRVRQMNKVGLTELYTEATLQKHLDKATHDTLRYIGAVISLYIPQTQSYLTLSLPKIVYAWHKGSVPIGYEIDHIDTNPLNNSIENLRLVSIKENQKNRKNWPMFTLEEISNKTIKEVKEMIDQRIEEYKDCEPLPQIKRTDTPKMIALRQRAQLRNEIKKQNKLIDHEIKKLKTKLKKILNRLETNKKSDGKWSVYNKEKAKNIEQKISKLENSKKN